MARSGLRTSAGVPLGEALMLAVLHRSREVPHHVRSIQRRFLPGDPVRINTLGYPKIEVDRKGVAREIWRGTDRRQATAWGFFELRHRPSVLRRNLFYPVLFRPLPLPRWGGYAA